MIANVLNTLIGLLLACLTVLKPLWIERQYFPMLAFAVVIFLLALWARRSDPARWFSSVNMLMGVLLAILALLPLPTLPNLSFWGGFWIGTIVPIVAFWALLYRPETQSAAD